MTLSVLRVRNIHCDDVRETRHSNAIEARRELVRLCGALRCTRDGDGRDGLLIGEGGRPVASYELWDSRDQGA